MRKVAAWLHTHARVRLATLLAAPLLWLVGAYLGALVVLLVSAFWTVNTFTGDLVEQPTLANFQALLDNEVYRVVALRTVGVAAAVTIVDALIALPMAFFMAKVAAARSWWWRS